MYKICHLSSAHSESDIRILKKECISLANNNYDVYYVVPNAENKEVEKVKVIGVKIKNNNKLYRILFTSYFVYKEALKIDADLYHFHDIELFYYGLKLLQKKKKVVFDSHENWPGYIMSVKRYPYLIRKTLSNFLILVYKLYLKKFSAVISVSPHIISELKKYSSKVYLLTNYPFLTNDNSSFVKMQDFIKRENKICYAGTIYKESNQKFIIEACQKIKEIKYEIIGIIDNYSKDDLLKYDKNNKTDFIQFLSKEELYNHYYSSICGMCIFDYFPNLGGIEGSLGVNKIFEYMACGLPIICSNHRLWKTLIIDKYRCGIAVNPGDVCQIYNAINYIINNKVEAYRMGQRGKNAVKQEFNWTMQENELLKIYKNIL